MRTRRWALPLLLVCGAGGVALSWAVAQHSLLGARWGLIWLVAAWVPLWLPAAWAAGRVDTRVSLAAVLLLAVALRLAAASGTTPSISNDLYRYSWDAHVQLSGVDPYRYPPTRPSWSRLRTSATWPAPPTCQHLGKPSGCTLLNRPQDRTIYPPVAEAWFVVVHVLTLGSGGSRPWQLAAGVVDDITIVLIAVALRGQRRDPRQVAWYALSPAPGDRAGRQRTRRRAGPAPARGRRAGPAPRPPGLGRGPDRPGHHGQAVPGRGGGGMVAPRPLAHGHRGRGRLRGLRTPRMSSRSGPGCSATCPDT